MTAEQYFALCEQMGYEVVEEEIPKDLGELPYDCQLALIIFNALPDRVGGMSGVWLGKDFSAIEFILALYEIENKKDIFDLILVIQQEYSKHYAEEHKRESSKKGR